MCWCLGVNIVGMLCSVVRRPKWLIYCVVDICHWCHARLTHTRLTPSAWGFGVATPSGCVVVVGVLLYARLPKQLCHKLHHEKALGQLPQSHTLVPLSWHAGPLTINQILGTNKSSVSHHLYGVAYYRIIQVDPDCQTENTTQHTQTTQFIGVKILVMRTFGQPGSNDAGHICHVCDQHAVQQALTWLVCIRELACCSVHVTAPVSVTSRTNIWRKICQRDFTCQVQRYLDHSPMLDMECVLM